MLIKNKRILIIGPFPEPLFGVSLSNLVLEKGIKSRGIKVSRIDASSGSNVQSAQGSWNFKKLSFLKNYFSLYKVFFADIIYCTIGQTFFGVLKYAPFVLFAKVLRKTSVVHVKGGYLEDSYNQMGLLKKIIIKPILKGFSKGIVLSKSLKPLLEPFLEESRIFIQHNFVQESLIIPQNKVFEKKDFSKLRLFFMSNLIPEKGIFEFLDALDALISAEIPFEAKIAGSIPDDQNDLLEKINILDNTEYLGVVSGKLKTELLSWGNVFCLPTYYPMEGQPISIIEAMGFGNFIVTTDHAGIPDICCKKNSLFVQKRDSKSLFKGLLELSKSMNQLESISLKNLQYARKKFSEEGFISGILKIFNEK